MHNLPGLQVIQFREEVRNKRLKIVQVIRWGVEHDDADRERGDMLFILHAMVRGDQSLESILHCQCSNSPFLIDLQPM